MSANHQYSALERAVHDVVSKADIEGRLVTQTNGTVMLFDCPLWSHKASSLLSYQHPNVIISVNQCISSLSGYVVIFEEKSNQIAFIRLIIAFVFGIFLFISFYVYYNRYYLLAYLHENYLSSFLNKKFGLQILLRLMHSFESYFS